MGHAGDAHRRVAQGAEGRARAAALRPEDLRRARAGRAQPARSSRRHRRVADVRAGRRPGRAPRADRRLHLAARRRERQHRRGRARRCWRKWLDEGKGRQIHFHWNGGTRDVDGLPVAHARGLRRGLPRRAGHRLRRPRTTAARGGGTAAIGRDPRDHAGRHRPAVPGRRPPVQPAGRRRVARTDRGGEGARRPRDRTARRRLARGADRVVGAGHAGDPEGALRRRRWSRAPVSRSRTGSS